MHLSHLLTASAYGVNYLIVARSLVFVVKLIPVYENFEVQRPSTDCNVAVWQFNNWVYWCRMVLCIHLFVDIYVLVDSQSIQVADVPIINCTVVLLDDQLRVERFPRVLRNASFGDLLQSHDKGNESARWVQTVVVEVCDDWHQLKQHRVRDLTLAVVVWVQKLEDQAVQEHNVVVLTHSALVLLRWANQFWRALLVLWFDYVVVRRYQVRTILQSPVLEMEVFVLECYCDG